MMRLVLFMVFSSGCFMAQSQDLPTFKFKNKGPALQNLDGYEWPETAPISFEALDGLEWRDPNTLFETKQKSHSAGKYQGPDGGIITVAEPGSWKLWKWDRQDGGLVIDSKNVTSIRYKNHYIKYYKRSQRTEWFFPDSSKIERQACQTLGVFKYVYFKRHQDHVDYKILMDTAHWNLAVTRQNNFVVYHPKRDQNYVDCFVSSQRIRDMNRFLRDSFQAENKAEIHVYIPNSYEDFSDYLNEKKPPFEGGRAYPEGFILFSEKIKKFEDYTEIQKAHSIAHDQFNLVIHELTHHILYHGKLNHPDYSDIKGHKYPLTYFTEGIAEFVCAKINLAYKSFIFKRFFGRVDEGSIPDLEGLNSRVRRNAYTFGSIICFYIEEKFGGEALCDYHLKTGMGVDPEVAIKEVTHLNLEALYQKAIDHYNSQQGEIEKMYETWYAASLPSINYDAEKEAGAFHKKVMAELPIKAKDIGEIPSFFKHYLFDYDLLKTHPDYLYLGPKGEKVQVFGKNGKDYSVKIDGFSIYHYFKDTEQVQTVQMQFKDHIIRSYSDGRREWLLPDRSGIQIRVDGTVVHF